MKCEVEKIVGMMEKEVKENVNLADEIIQVSLEKVEETKA